MPTPKLTKTELREQLEAALANYSGPVTRCPPGHRWSMVGISALL